MKTKSILLVALLLSISTVISANTADTIPVMQGEFKTLESQVNKLKTENSRLRNKVLKLEKSYDITQDSISVINTSVKQNKEDISFSAQTLENEISEVEQQGKSTKSALTESIKEKSIYGIVAIAVSMLISIVLAIILYVKSKNNIGRLSEQANKLNEKIVGKLSLEIQEISKLGAAMSALKNTSNEPADKDHSLVKLISARIVMMERALSKMDSKVKGFRDLSKAIQQIKDNLLANGYELVDMINKPFDDGLLVDASFVIDDTLNEGEKIITKVIQPQINYNGNRIQKAKIEVSQNI